jgi:mRNA interferase YafQ
MFAIEFTPAFVRDLKKYCKQGGDIDRVHVILDQLRKGEALPQSLHDHQLLGKLSEYRELHVGHDWLLVYKKDGKHLHIFCIWLVTHKKLRERERSV